MLIHLLTPNGLSWTRNGVPKTEAQRSYIIREKKRARPEELCLGLPPVFEEFLRCCRRLKFAECPDYAHWREEFADLAREQGWADAGSDEFFWPPRPIEVLFYHPSTCGANHCAKVAPPPRKAAPPPPAREPAPSPATVDIEKVLGDIANLNLNENRISGSKRPAEPQNSEPAQGDEQNRNPAPGPERAAENQANIKPPQQQKQPSVIVISSDPESHRVAAPRPATRSTKAAAINGLTKQVPRASDNNALAQLLREFADVLKANRSKMLTREGFAFLAALERQLADPSVFLVSDSAHPKEGARPLREGSDRGSRGCGHGTQASQEAAVSAGSGAVRAVRQRLDASRAALSNGELGEMLADFCAATRKTSGRSVTKDGFGFLAGLEARLRT